MLLTGFKMTLIQGKSKNKKPKKKQTWKLSKNALSNRKLTIKLLRKHIANTDKHK